MPGLPSSAEIVVIGGGVMGLFTAWECVKRGENDLIVIEKRSFLGSGSTQKAAGGVRAQFTNRANVAMSMYSQDFYRRKFAPEIFPDFEYSENGYLFFARSEEKLHALGNSYELQKQVGVEAVRQLTPEQILEILPDLMIDEVLGGNYSPEDGFVDPGDIINGLDTKLRQAGIQIFTDLEVEVVEHGESGHRIVTGQGTVSCSKVLFATGAWSGELMKRCGVDIPVEPFRRSLYITKPLPWFPKKAPFSFDVVTGTHFRPESGGIMFLKINPDEVAGFNEDPDWDWLEHVVPDLFHVMPRLGDAEVMDAWGGLYAMTPDHSAILGVVPGKPGWFVATGFSGHGMMHAPGVGCSMAEMILDGRTSTLDISAYRFERYAENDPVHEAAVF